MNSLEGILNPLRRLEGLVDASVVVPSTGQVLQSLDLDDAVTPVVAGAAADALRALMLMGVLLGREGDRVRDVMITTDDRHHLVRVLPGAADDLFVLVTLDRERTNLALALRRLRDLDSVHVA